MAQDAAYQSGNFETPKTKESVQKRNFQLTRDDSDPEELDADAANKRQKVVSNENNVSTCAVYTADNETDPLLDELAQALTETEKTALKVSDKLAKNVNLSTLA